jgi:hypothetical protein
MQKVVGSSPIIRSREGPANRGVFCFEGSVGSRGGLRVPLTGTKLVSFVHALEAGSAGFDG